MAQADVIREFLVSLGFKTDERSLKNFSENIERSTKSVAQMVLSIEAAAVAVGAAVTVFAARFEQLYFASQRTGASVKNIKAMSFAAENLGASANDALGAIEGLAGYMRDVPGGDTWIKSMFGVDSLDEAGQARDKAEMLLEIGQKLAKMPWWEAKARAEPLHISDNMLMALRNGDFSRFVADWKEANKDVDFEETGRKAHEFEMRLRELQTRIEAIVVPIGESLLKAFGPDMENAAKWFAKNSDEISNSVKTVGESISTVGGFVAPILKTIADYWKDIYDWVKAAGEKINEVMPSAWGDKIGAGAAWLFDKLGIRGAVDKAMGLEAQPAKPSGGGHITADYAMRILQGFGWTKEQAAGLVGNIKNESSFNPAAENAGHYGLAQWDKKRQADFERWSGKNIRNSTADEQLAFMNYELTRGAEQKAGALLSASRSAGQAANVVYMNYERAGASDMTGPRRASDAVQIAQNTTINVTGGDPIATGSAVANEQTRVNERLARNFQAGAR